MSIRQYQSPQLQHFQRGAVLFVSLVILLILSLFALVTMKTAMMETKMSGSMRNMQLARLAADSALSEGKVRISQLTATGGASQVCASLTCVVRDSSSPVDPADFMLTAKAKAAMIPFRVDLTKLSGNDESARLAALPVYVVEDLGVGHLPTTPLSPGTAPSIHNFRITARGVGGTKSFVNVAENVYAVAE